MKAKYSGLWALLTVAFVAIVVASAFDTIGVGGLHLKTASIVACLTEPAADVAATVTDVAADSSTALSAAAVTVAATASTSTSSSSASTRSADLPPIPSAADTVGGKQRILLIGDSMLEGLSPRLAAYAEHNGHELYTVIWYSSTTQVWGECDTLTTFIRRFRPSYVMVCVGANELFVRDIESRRDRYVKRLLQQIGSLPYLWIGPPNWKPDTGINALIENNVRRGAFFRSADMSFERKPDGAHPTMHSAAMWVDSIARWMPNNCCSPIAMDTPPDDLSARPRRVVVLKPKK